MSHACSQSAWSNHLPDSSYPCYPPSLGVALVAVVVVVILGKHIALGHLRGVELAAPKDARRRIHHGRAGGVEAILGGIHGGVWARVRGILGFGVFGVFRMGGWTLCRYGAPSSFVSGDAVRAWRGLVLGSDETQPRTRWTGCGSIIVADCHATESQRRTAERQKACLAGV